MKSSFLSTFILLLFVALSAAVETEAEAAVPRVRGGEAGQRRQARAPNPGRMRGYMKGWTTGKMNPHGTRDRGLNQGKMTGLTRGKMKGWTRPRNPH
jgi:hypothetical protein